MTNELTNERLREIANRSLIEDESIIAAELLAKRQEVEALTKERDSQAREAAGYQKIAKEMVNAEEPGLLVLLVSQHESEVRIFGPDRDAEERFAEVVARWWKLLQVTAEGLELEDRTKDRDAAQAESARLASSLAAVERQRDDLKQWIAAYRDKLGNYPETAHGQRVACDDILERMEAEPAQGGQP